MDISIDKKSGVPIYKQIVEQITKSVKKGELRVGDKLIPERELANRLSISRGTVTRAYMHLERNQVIEIVQGSGCFVSDKQNVLDVSRKDRAIGLISDTIGALEDMHFTQDEIRIFIELILSQKERSSQKIHIVLIDCNHEALAFFMKQLAYIPDLVIHNILLEDLGKKLTDVEDTLRYSEFAITTTNHFEEVEKLIGDRIPVQKISVTTSQQTIIDLSRIKRKQKVSLICQSDRFMGIIHEAMRLFEIRQGTSTVQESFSGDEIRALTDASDVIVMPALSPVYGRHQKLFDTFTAEGGVVICFEYQIERGSLLHVEELITGIIRDREEAL